MGRRRVLEWDTKTVTWKDINMIDLKKGSVFRMYESDGTSVTDKSGKIVFLATSDAYVNKDGIVTVEIHDPAEDAKQWNS